MLCYKFVPMMFRETCLAVHRISKRTMNAIAQIRFHIFKHTDACTHIFIRFNKEAKWKLFLQLIYAVLWILVHLISNNPQYSLHLHTMNVFISTQLLGKVCFFFVSFCIFVNQWCFFCVILCYIVPLLHVLFYLHTPLCICLLYICSGMENVSIIFCVKALQNKTKPKEKSKNSERKS